MKKANGDGIARLYPTILYYYVSANLVPVAWSLSSYKRYREVRSIAGSLARILKKTFVRLIRYRCTVNFHRNSTLSPSPLYRDRPTIPLDSSKAIPLQLICDDAKPRFAHFSD